MSKQPKMQHHIRSARAKINERAGEIAMMDPQPGLYEALTRLTMGRDGIRVVTAGYGIRGIDITLAIDLGDMLKCHGSQYLYVLFDAEKSDDVVIQALFPCGYVDLRKVTLLKTDKLPSLYTEIIKALDWIFAHAKPVGAK